MSLRFISVQRRVHLVAIISLCAVFVSIGYSIDSVTNSTMTTPLSSDTPPESADSINVHNNPLEHNDTIQNTQDKRLSNSKEDTTNGRIDSQGDISIEKTMAETKEEPNTSLPNMEQDIPSDSNGGIEGREVNSGNGNDGNNDDMTRGINHDGDVSDDDNIGDSTDSVKQLNEVETESPVERDLQEEPGVPLDEAGQLINDTQHSSIEENSDVAMVTSDEGAGPDESVEDNDDIVTFEEFKSKMNQEGVNAKPVQVGSSIPARQSYLSLHNYALSECGATVLESNKEAKNAGSILLENKDLYMLNPCSAEIWFVIELCELVSVSILEIGCFELFSSIPETIAVYSSDSYPNPVWEKLGIFLLTDERGVQKFPLEESVYTKHIKFELLSHYGSEHYCPISTVRVLGSTMIEEYEYTESQRDGGSSTTGSSTIGGDGNQMDANNQDTVIQINNKNEGDDGPSLSSNSDDSDGNPIKAATDAILTFVGKAVNGLMGPLDEEYDELLDNSDHLVQHIVTNADSHSKVHYKDLPPDTEQSTTLSDSHDSNQLAKPKPPKRITSLQINKVATENQESTLIVNNNTTSSLVSEISSSENTSECGSPPPTQLLEPLGPSNGIDEPSLSTDIPSSSSFRQDKESLANLAPTNPGINPTTIEASNNDNIVISTTSGIQFPAVSSSTNDTLYSSSSSSNKTPSSDASSPVVTTLEEDDQSNSITSTQSILKPSYTESSTETSQQDSSDLVSNNTSANNTLSNTADTIKDIGNNVGDPGDDRVDSNGSDTNVSHSEVNALPSLNSNSGTILQPSIDSSSNDNSDGGSVDSLLVDGDGLSSAGIINSSSNTSSQDSANETLLEDSNNINNNNSASYSSGPREKSVFVRLSNRINVLEVNMTLFDTYLAQISQSLKKNKNRTEDMQRMLERRISSLNETVLFIKDKVQINASLFNTVISSVTELNRQYHSQQQEWADLVSYVSGYFLGIMFLQFFTLMGCCVMNKFRSNKIKQLEESLRVIESHLNNLNRRLTPPNSPKSRRHSNGDSSKMNGTMKGSVTSVGHAHHRSESLRCSSTPDLHDSSILTSINGENQKWKKVEHKNKHKRSTKNKSEL